jgi:hypothetical protein
VPRTSAIRRTANEEPVADGMAAQRSRVDAATTQRHTSFRVL